MLNAQARSVRDWSEGAEHYGNYHTTNHEIRKRYDLAWAARKGDLIIWVRWSNPFSPDVREALAVMDL